MGSATIDIQSWAKQNKVPLIIGGGVLGAIVLYSLSKRNTVASSSTDNSVTLATLHSDLQSIDNRLQQENSYLSSGSSMSPLVPSIDISDSFSMAPEYETNISAPHVSSPAPGHKHTAVAARTASARPHGLLQPSGRHSPGPQPSPRPFGGPIPPEPGTGMGPGDYLAYWYGGSFNFPGDASDFYGLN